MTQPAPMTVLPRRMQPGRMVAPGGNLHFGVDVDIAADEFHTVIQMALKGGSITLLRQFKIFFGGRHKNPPYI